MAMGYVQRSTHAKHQFKEKNNNCDFKKNLSALPSNFPFCLQYIPTK